MKQPIHDRFLLWLTKIKPAQEVIDNGILHFTKFWLFNLFGLQIFLHKYENGIPKANPHTHTYNYAISFIIFGWYKEDVWKYYTHSKSYYGFVATVEQYLRRWFNVITPTTIHNVVEVKPFTWTFYIAGPSVKPYRYLNLENMALVEPKRQRYKNWYKGE